MENLLFIGEKAKSVQGINLYRLYKNVLIPDHQYNQLAFLKQGSVLWFDMGGHYNVYELQSDMEYNEGTMQSLIDGIMTLEM